MNISNNFIEENNLHRLKYIEDNALRIKKMGFKEYKKHHTKFINSQFDMKKRVFLNLAKEENGIEKISELTGASKDLVKRFIQKHS